MFLKIIVNFYIKKKKSIFLDNTILAGAFYAHYSAPAGFSFDILNNDDPIQDNPNLENYNVNGRVNDFVNYLITMVITNFSTVDFYRLIFSAVCRDGKG